MTKLGVTALAAIVFGLFVTIGVVAQIGNLAYGLWFTEFLFVAVPWIALRRRGIDPVADTGLRFAGLHALGLGLLIGLANVAFVVAPLAVLSRTVFQRFSPHLVEMFTHGSLFQDKEPVEVGALLAALVVAAPVCEEFFFRGVLFNRLLAARTAAGRTGRGLVPLVVIAIVFSAFHLDPVGFVVRVELGLLLGVVFLRTGSLWPGIGIHAANNFVAGAALFSFRGRDLAANVESNMLVPCAALAAVGLVSIFAMTRILPRGALPSAPGTAPRGSRLRLAWPWMAGAGASFVLLGAIDFRGIELNFIDLGVRLPEDDKLDDDARDDLEAFRKGARRGDVSMKDYIARRRALGADVSSAGKGSP